MSYNRQIITLMGKLDLNKTKLS